jgi:glucokinase
MRLAVGVDLGGTNARAALVDVDQGAIVGDDQRLPVEDRSPEAVADLVLRVVQLADPDNVRLGVGVGFAGMLRAFTGVVANAPNFGWREVDFRSLLRVRVGDRTELYNDANAIAYGETVYGAARGFRDVLLVAVGTGIGGGLVTGGRLYIGANHLAGEVGHVKVIPGGRLCGCGQQGCLEAYVGGRNLQKRAQDDLAKTTSLAVELAGGVEQVHAGHLEDAAARGDRYASELLAHAGLLLGVALANMVTTLNPARLVMGGGMWPKSPYLREHTVRHFHSNVNQPSLEGFAIIDATLGEASGVLGAAALIASC